MLAAAVLLASSCGSGTSAAPGDLSGASTESTSVAPSSTTADPGTTRPNAGATPQSVEGDDALDAALATDTERWSTLEPWGDGWVEIEAVVDGIPVADRNSAVGALFPDEVFDAIEAAGATDVAAAVDAVSEAGLLPTVLAVLEEHPEALDQILTATGTFPIVARTTIDGVTWSEPVPVPVVAAGPLAGSGSDGDRLALAFGDRDTGLVQVATTADLTEWAVTDLTPGDGPRVGEIAVNRMVDGWYVLPSQGGSRHEAWILDDDGDSRPASPAFADVAFSVESTDAGLIAWDHETEDSSRLMFSADGLEWEPRSLPFDDALSGIAAVDDGLVVSRFVPDRGPSVHLGTADGRDWGGADLPSEVDFPVWIRSDHHRGVVQRVGPVGRGRGGAVRPVVPHVTVVEHDGRVYRFEFDGFDLLTTVTDARSGETLGHGSSELGEGDGYSRIGYADDVLTVYSDDFAPLGEVPTAVFEAADEAAGTAALDALSAEAVALHEDRYVLTSFDGRRWDAVVLPGREDPDVGTLQVVGVNGTRVLFGDGTDYWLHEGGDR